ncbi:MAG: hypothetical protein R3A45_11965 [Bdellovibrionota bacterium]
MKKLIVVCLVVWTYMGAAFAESQVTLIIANKNVKTKVKKIIIDEDKPIGQLFPLQNKEEGDRSDKVYYYNGYTYDYILFSFGRSISMINGVRQDKQDREDGTRLGWGVYFCATAESDEGFTWAFLPGSIDDFSAEDGDVIAFVYPQNHRPDLAYCKHD